MTQRTSRRQFLQNAGVGAAGFWIAGRQVGYGQEKSPNAQVNIACIGTGGQGGSDMGNVAKLGNIVALCDIDDKTNDKAAEKFPKAKKFYDYRKMFDEIAKEIDCVTVGIPDNHHACASIMAMKLGKGAYTQKPLTHDIYEARQMTEVASKMKVATQMGNQGSAGNNLRESVEIVQAGLIGEVKEVHLWTNRPIWPQSPGVTSRSKEGPAPAHVHWDEWLGPAPERPYSPAYHPFKWRGWWDFGTGALGDMACHTTNLPYRALKLGAPTTVEAECEPINPETYPGWAKVTYEFPDRGAGFPACKVIWYEGKKNDVLVQPPTELYQGEKISGSGSLLVGTKGTLYSPDDYGGSSKWLMKDGSKDMQKPAPSIPRNKGGHHAEWIEAVKGGAPGYSNFAQAGPFTEFVLLGNLAMKLGKKFEWDSANLKAKNCPEADHWIKREYRKGWSL
jgi:predicted dehydrogenase